MNALLLTGSPGIGKTTILRKVVASLPTTKLRGFLTDEIRRDKERAGFRLAPFEGDGAVLAHVDSTSPQRVGRYGMEVAALERVVESTLIPADSGPLHRRRDRQDGMLLAAFRRGRLGAARFPTTVSCYGGAKGKWLH